MNEYEMMTVFHPRMNADETTAAVTSLEEQIVANGGELLSTDNWGRRRLAYPIDGAVDGTYVLMTFKMPAEGAAPLERWIRLSESTLRHLLIRGIIPFEGDRHGRDDRDDRYGRDDRDDRDDRDRDDRDEGDDRDARDSGESEQPRSEASAAPAAAVAESTPEAAADAAPDESSDEGGEAAPTDED